MYFMKRAFKYLSRKVGKTILLSIIFIVISNLIIAGLLVEQASKQSQEEARKTVGTDVVYVFDTLAYAETAAQGGANVRDVMRLSMSSGFFSSDEITEGGGPTFTNLMVALDSEYVKEAYYKVSAETDIEGISAYTTQGKKGASGFTSVLYGGSQPQDMVDGTVSLSEGRLASDEEILMGSPVVIISEALAEINGLSVGDTLSTTLNNIDGESYHLDQEIIGIFTVSSQENSSMGLQQFGSTSVKQNDIYTPFSVLSQLPIDEASLEHLIISDNKIVLEDPEDLDEYRDSIEDLAGKYGDFDANDALYTSMVGPIESLGLVSQIFVLAIIITGAFIIGLITALTINERKGEVGILLAIGESKWKIVMQFLVEVLVIAIIAFGISIVTGSLLGQELSANLLDSNIFSSTSTQSTGALVGMKTGGVMSNIGRVTPQESPALTLSINLWNVLQIFGIGIMLTVVSTLIPSLYVMRYNPKEILSSRG